MLLSAERSDALVPGVLPPKFVAFCDGRRGQAATENNRATVLTQKSAGYSGLLGQDSRGPPACAGMTAQHSAYHIQNGDVVVSAGRSHYRPLQNGRRGGACNQEDDQEDYVQGGTTQPQ